VLCFASTEGDMQKEKHFVDQASVPWGSQPGGTAADDPQNGEGKNRGEKKKGGYCFGTSIEFSRRGANRVRGNRGGIPLTVVVNVNGKTTVRKKWNRGHEAFDRRHAGGNGRLMSRDPSYLRRLVGLRKKIKQRLWK